MHFDALYCTLGEAGEAGGILEAGKNLLADRRRDPGVEVGRGQAVGVDARGPWLQHRLAFDQPVGLATERGEAAVYRQRFEQQRAA